MSQVTEPFEIHGEHRGVKFTLDEFPSRYMLYTWHSLTSEYIFERSIKRVDEAIPAIDQLIDDGFLKP